MLKVISHLFVAGYHIVTGGFNNPGISQEEIKKFSALLTCYNLTIVNNAQTHLHTDGEQSKLKLIIELDDTHHLSLQMTHPIVFSHNSLPAMQLNCVKSRAVVVIYSFCDFHCMHFRTFRRSLQYAL